MGNPKAREFAKQREMLVTGLPDCVEVTIGQANKKVSVGSEFVNHRVKYIYRPGL